MNPEYNAIRNDLETGDIVLFSGKGMLSAGIKRFTSSPWSHVEMVVCLEEWDIKAAWGSTTMPGVADIMSGELLSGVQIVPLSDRVKSYDGNVAVRRLHATRSAEMIQALKDLRQELRGRPYEESAIELIKAAYDGPFGGNETDLSSLFCSELVAEAYRSMGLLGSGLPSNEFTPADFAGDLALQFGSLGEIQMLKGGKG